MVVGERWWVVAIEEGGEREREVEVVAIDRKGDCFGVGEEESKREV